MNSGFFTVNWIFRKGSGKAKHVNHNILSLPTKRASGRDYSIEGGQISLLSKSKWQAHGGEMRSIFFGLVRIYLGLLILISSMANGTPSRRYEYGTHESTYQKGKASFSNFGVPKTSALSQRMFFAISN
jgi:hypothetical protein